MVKKDSLKLRKIWFTTILSFSLIITSVIAGAEEISQIEGESIHSIEQTLSVDNEMVEAEAALEDAGRVLEEAQLKVEACENVLEDLENKLVDAEAELAAAEVEVSAAEGRLAAAEAEIEKYSEGSAEYDEALRSFNDAKAEADKAQTALDAAEKALQDATAAVEEAEAAVEEAKEKAEQITEQNMIKTEALNSAVEKAENDIKEAEADLLSAENNKNEKDVALEKADEVLNEAGTVLEEAESAVGTAEAEFIEAEALLNTAQAEYDAKKAVVQQKIDEAQAEVDDACMQYVLENCIKYEKDGVEYNSYEMWVNYLKGNATLSKYINDEFFATVEDLMSEDNLKKSMALADKCNELRGYEGVGELYVDYDMMLLSAISTAISEQGRNALGHAFFDIASMDFGKMRVLFNNAIGASAKENIAWSYSDPFGVWYDVEKKLYDENPDSPLAGHYRNIISGNVNVTGINITDANTAEQCFGYKKGSSLTTDKFLKGLGIFSKSAKDALEEAKKVLAEIDDSAIKNAENVVAEKEAALEEAKSAAGEAEKAHGEAKSAYEEAKFEAEKAGKAVENVKDKVDEAKKAYDEAKKALDDFVPEDGTILVEQAEAELAVATDVSNNAVDKQWNAKRTWIKKLMILEDAESALEALNSKRTDAEAEVASAEDELEAAEKLLEEKQQDRDGYGDAVEKAKTDLTAAEATLNDAEKTYKEKEIALEAVKAKVLADSKVAAKIEINEYKDADDYRDAEQAELIAIIASAEAAINSAASIEEVQTAVAEAKAKLDAIKTDEELNAQGKIGDANGDKKVNVKDAVLVLQYANKKNDAESLDVMASDVNGDGKVNVKDATVILQYANKKIDKFPVENKV